jgi:hypothetical protein
LQSFLREKANLDGLGVSIVCINRKPAIAYQPSMS